MKIDLIENKDLVKNKVYKERMDIYIPDIPKYLPNRNGSIINIIGSGGSGKSNLLNNLFKQTKYYKKKFHNIYYFCPSSSFCSIEKHPFEKHDKIFHELTVEILEDIYNELINIKEEGQIEYSCIIIDDFANKLKDNDIIKQLNKMIIKARHISCSFIFLIQNFYYMPKIIREQLTYVILFKTKNIEEWHKISKELINLNNEESLELFNYCFNEKYNHLDIDTVLNKYYLNFNELIFKN